MFFSADQIADHHSSSRLGIEPFEPKLLKPASYLLRLGNQVRRWERQNSPIDLMTENCSELALGKSEQLSEFLIEQGDLLLVSSLESIWLPSDLVGFLSTTSHMARAGISVTCDSQVVSPGFGQGAPCGLTFEIVSHNPSPVVLKFGTPVCHIMFATVGRSKSPLQLSRSIYEASQNPSGPCLSEELARIGLLHTSPFKIEE
ncbi:dCTP deaminase [Crateriforma conspicua]|uniref:Deoxycytidine triphosphate deaminase n=1 Tax=Crateriforma conspicua TaxID=2527996 RepID=A0A5C5Y3H9_9PLAN|nr:Deoxycytidine triphosphate deaminase [Crateriforma conspicua]